MWVMHEFHTIFKYIKIYINIFCLFIIRLLHRAVDASTLSMIEENIQKEKAKQEKIAAKVLERQQSDLVQRSTSQTSVSSSIDSNASFDSNNAIHTVHEGDVVLETESQSIKDSSSRKSSDKLGTEKTVPIERKDNVRSKSKDEPMDTDESHKTSKSTSIQPTNSELAVAGPSAARDPMDELNDIPGVSVIRPGQYQLTPEENEVSQRTYIPVHIQYFYKCL